MTSIKTIKQFAKQSHINESLIRAVVRQIGGWESFKESAADVANHGANGGFSGFIYYTDTIAFFKRNKNNIIELMRHMAQEFGEDSMTMVANFNCLKTEPETVADAIYNSRTKDEENVRNALVWFALEEVARSYVDATYND